MRIVLEIISIIEFDMNSRDRANQSMRLRWDIRLGTDVQEFKMFKMIKIGSINGSYDMAGILEGYPEFRPYRCS